MKHLLFALIPLLAAACGEKVIYVHDPVSAIGACTDITSASSDSGSSGGEVPDLGASSESSSSGGEGPTFTCPTIAEGDVQFCAEGYPCRTATFMNVGNASPSSTLLMYWHGTHEGNNNPISNALPYGFLEGAVAANALVAMPRADIEAVNRPNNPFPWWQVCGQVAPAQCTRDDDFVLADMIAMCAVEQGLADPDRLTTSGMSAGGIQTSLLIESGLEGGLSFAAAVSWSGGTVEAFQPTEPASPNTSVFVLHGGETDVYCGAGQPAGTCNGFEPYSFVDVSEEMAADIAAAGNFTFVCDHESGHNPAMAPQGTEFLLGANAGAPHPWTGFPFGVDGYDGWPGMSGGTNWMLRFWGDCHYPGA